MAMRVIRPVSQHSPRTTLDEITKKTGDAGSRVARAVLEG